MKIRKATIYDSEFIGRIYTESWKATYSGMVSKEYLDSLSYQDAENKWKRFLNSKDNILLVAESDSKVIGFIAGCSTGIAGQSELYALYVDISLKNRGTGSKLLASLIIELKNMGMQSLIVWAMAKNINAISYYKNKGAIECKRRINTFGNEKVEDICLIWDDITMLEV